MSTRLNPIRVADDVFEFAVSSPTVAQDLANRLREKGLAEDIVAGLCTVAVRFDPADLDPVTTWLSQIESGTPVPNIDATPLDIAIQYGGDHGPDLVQICEALDITTGDFIAAHTTPIHSVEMIGFTPGFAYISGLPEQFSIPRLATPRPRVPAGSVGISAAFTGIYALLGPGGWPLIGRTDAALFDAGRDAPFLLQPGQRVRFRAV